MSVPVFSQAAVLEAVTPQDAYGAVRNAFLAHALRRVDDAAEGLRDELPGR